MKCWGIPGVTSEKHPLAAPGITSLTDFDAHFQVAEDHGDDADYRVGDVDGFVMQRPACRTRAASGSSVTLDGTV